MYDGSPDQRTDEMREKLAAFVSALEGRAEKRAAERKAIETRWLEDLRQYHGVYDSATLKRLEGKKRSKVFMNLTRPKTNGVIAKLWDLLFPTDDRNWSIGPTPVPESDRFIEDRREIASAAKENLRNGQQRMEEASAAQNQDGVEQARQEMNAAQKILQQAEEEADRLQEEKRAANAQALLMQDEIDDQLKSSRYGAEARDMITDGCKIGTGVLKGPVNQGKRRRRFQQSEGGYQMVEVDDHAPGAQWVDPWSFFPDNNAKNPADGDGVFERHLLNAKQMRDLQRRQDIDTSALKRVIEAGAKRGNVPWYLTELTNLTQEETSVVSESWTVWEFSGEITGDDLQLLALGIDAARDEYEDIADDEGKIDPLASVSARIWFCQGEILSFAIHPLDSQECMYSIWNYEPAEHGPWGYGVPYIMRHEQSSVNAARRMIMDNGALSAGPQVVINKAMVSPENGDWNLEPNKVWVWNNPEEGQPVTDPFRTYNINANLGELAGIIDLAKQTIDEITIPAIAQGEQGATQAHKTFQGLALMMNSAGVMLRRLVRDFDDQVTTPMIRRFYEWNMQFSDKEAIKGDYEVEARGSSVLLVREMQAQNLMMIAQNFGDHPVYGPLLKHKAIMDLIFRALMVPTSDITKTEREVEEDMERAAKQMPPEAQAAQADAEFKMRDLQVREREIEAKVEIANMEADSRRYVADRTFDAVMERVANEYDLSREELDRKFKKGDREDAVKVAIAEREIDAKDRHLATEVAMVELTGKSAGGSV